ncbi:MAG: hypothetical protein KDA20_09235 [Phycisphaerales bacterium]|nr:hypothetical protein [Phycisphaerales bacterium]
MRTKRNACHAIALVVPALAAGFAQGETLVDPFTIDGGAVGLNAVTFDALDLDGLRTVEADRRSRHEVEQFAVGRRTALSPADVGTLEDLGNGMVAWRLRIESANAVNINVGTYWHVPPSTTMYMLDQFGDTPYRAITAADNNVNDQFWTPHVDGPTMELYVEVKASEWRDFVEGFQLTQVNLGFTSVDQLDGQPSARSAACHIDVACPEADPWQFQVAAVGRYFASTPSGTFLCSGALINNTAEDGRPLFYTANHCPATEGFASMVVWWNYENSVCRPPGSAQSAQPGNGSSSQFSSGATLLMTYSPADTTLVELNTAPPTFYQVNFIGWSRVGTTVTTGFGIHHPNGQEKRISLENDIAPRSGNFYVVDYDEGGVEGGSSGSPFFDNNGLAVGTACCVNTLTPCSSPAQITNYGALSQAWNGGGTSSSRLRDHLDPLNSGVTALAGLGAPPPDPPAPFNLTAPANGATELNSQGNISCTWTLSDSGVVYTFVLSENSDLSSPIMTTNPGSGFQTIGGGTLNGNTTYYWGVEAEALGQVTQSTPYPSSFTTASVAGNCTGDADGDNAVTLQDLNIVLFNFGNTVAPGTNGDVDGDGAVTLNDLNIVLFNFGTVC